MAALASILDKKACGGSVGANTGKLGCLSLFGTPTHFILVQKAFKIPVDQAFDIAYITEQVQKSIFTPLIDASAFEDLSAEDAYNTNTSGIKRLNLDGLVELKFTFEEGHEFYKEIDKLKSYKAFDAILGDDEGNWMFVVNSDGTTGGFSLGHVTPEKRTFKVKGGDSEMKTVMFQMLNRLQYDRDYGILHADSQDVQFTPQEVPSVNGVELAFNAVPEDADVTFEITALLSSDKETIVEGLLIGNFLYKVDGAEVTPSDVSEDTPGVYTFTAAAVSTGDVMTVDLWYAAYNSHVAVDAGGVLYRSDVASETVISGA